MFHTIHHFGHGVKTLNPAALHGIYLFNGSLKHAELSLEVIYLRQY
jgi:hypothetical protein